MNKQTAYILLLVVIFMAVWLSLFKFFYKNSRVHNRIAMYISSHTRIPASYSYSVFASVFYSAVPIAGSLVLSMAFGFDVGNLFKNYNGNCGIFIDIITGELTVMALTSVPLVVFALIYSDIQIAKEIRQINWISGILKMPGKWPMVVPCISACCEEFFFRGAVFGILMSAKMSFFWTTIVVTILFALNQIVLTKNFVQAFVLGASSVAISVVSCLLIGLTGNIIPSLVVHASFAGFYSRNV